MSSLYAGRASASVVHNGSLSSRALGSKSDLISNKINSLERSRARITENLPAVDPHPHRHPAFALMAQEQTFLWLVGIPILIEFHPRLNLRRASGHRAPHRETCRFRGHFQENKTSFRARTIGSVKITIIFNQNNHCLFFCAGLYSANLNFHI